MKKTKVKIGAIVACLLISCFSIYGSAFALFTDNKLDGGGGIVGDVHVELVEDFPTNAGETGADGNTKTFWGQSKGSKRTLVRASIFTTVEYKSGNEWVTYAVPQSDVVYTIDPETLDSSKEKYWIDGNDGYYYYNKILHPGDATSKFKVLDVALKSIPDALAGKEVRYKMTIRLEGAQATHEAYKSIFNITELPAGVEKLDS